MDFPNCKILKIKQLQKFDHFLNESIIGIFGIF